ncbi:MAG TPA: carboxypeptidase-like regulatory domain-containing protein [Bryobacteraceae bacterium]
MRNRSARLLMLAASLAGLALSMAWAEAPMTELQINVKTQGGHAIDRAEVIVRWKANAKHPAERYGKAVSTTFEMRTNQDGIAKVPAIPQGSILIQVNAKGYQTFGHVFEVEEDEKTIDVVLNQPQQQYSAH